MKFLVLFLVFVAASTMIDARPSKSSVPSTKRNEDIKETLKMSNEVERSKKHISFGRIQYPGWDSSSVNVAQASASAHSHSSHHHHHHHRLPQLSTSHSEAHSFSANVNLPYSSVSIAHSEAHQHQQTLG